jgi:hypothetical protein
MEAYRAPTADFAGAPRPLDRGPGPGDPRGELRRAGPVVQEPRQRGLSSGAPPGGGGVVHGRHPPLAPGRRRPGPTWSSPRSKAGLEPLDRGDLASTVRRLLLLQSLAEAEWLVLILAAVVLVLLSLRATVLGSAGQPPPDRPVPPVVPVRGPLDRPMARVHPGSLFVVSTAGINVEVSRAPRRPRWRSTRRGRRSSGSRSWRAGRASSAPTEPAAGSPATRSSPCAAESCVQGRGATMLSPWA